MGLRAARIAQGWSQSDAARALARTAADRGMRVAVPASLKTQLSRWENGHAVPEAPYRVLLAELYGRTAVELGLEPTGHVAPAPDPAGRLRARVAAAAAVDGAVVALWKRQLTTLQELDDRLGAAGAAAAVRVLVDQLEAVLPHLSEPADRRAVAALAVLQHGGLEPVAPHPRAQLSAATAAVRAAAGHTESDLRLAVDVA